MAASIVNIDSASKAPLVDTAKGSLALAGVQRMLLVVQSAVAAMLLLAIGMLLLGVAPTFAGFESFAVYSGSMEPALKVGSLAVVKPTRSTDLKPGDIITYRTPTQPDFVVTHRLVAIEQTPTGQQQYRTKGDANAVEDLVLVDPNAVLGKVIYSVPYAGYSVEFVRTNQGRMVVIVLPALVLALDYARQRLRRRVTRDGAAPAAEAPSLVLGHQERVEALLRRGREAFDAGHLELAGRAADGVLASEPRNEDAWLLKVDCQIDDMTRLMLLRTALAVNPDSVRIAGRLAQIDGPTAGSAVSLANPESALDGQGRAHG